MKKDFCSIIRIIIFNHIQVNIRVIERERERERERDLLKEKEKMVYAPRGVKNSFKSMRTEVTDQPAHHNIFKFLHLDSEKSVSVWS